MSEGLRRKYRSFSGVDIQAVFNGIEIGTLQGISYTVTREKAPQYVMGRVDPISFSRGKRGIAGSLVFLVFDRSNLITELRGRKFWADKFDAKLVGETAESSQYLQVDPLSQQFLNAEEIRQNLTADRVQAEAWYHDQLPPFDIVLTAATEYGMVCKMALHNCEILNAGSGMSVDDITTDENMTFVATDITPWKPVASAPGPSFIDFGTLGKPVGSGADA